MAEGIVVNIQGDDINKMIAQAILDSTLGEAVRKTVEDVVGDFTKVRGWGSDSKVRDVLNVVIREEVTKIVRAEYVEQIRTEIRAQLEHELQPDKGLVEKVVSNMLEGRYRD